MRATPAIWLVTVLLASGCSLDREGLGEYADTGGSSPGGAGGVAGSGGWDASAGSGGSGLGGFGASGGSGQGGFGASGGSSGTGSTGGSAGNGGTSAGGSTADGGTSAGGSAGDGGTSAGGSAGAGGDDAGTDAPEDSPVLTEDCFNGLDDDSDSKADCADEDCTAVVMCVPVPPSGWRPPGFLRGRAPGAPPSACGDFEAAGPFYRNLVEGAHLCACDCGNPSGGVCTGGTVRMFTADDCVGASIELSGSGCLSLAGSTGTNSPQSISASPPSPTSQGTCQAFASASIDTPTWANAADLCISKQTFGGCAGGMQCIYRPPTGFPSEACIARDGAQTCPTPYPAQQPWYTGFEDTRDCTTGACSCGPATSGHCGGTILFHSDTACGASTTIRAYDLDDTCKNAHLGPGEAKSLNMNATGPSGGKCTAAGTGAQTGSVSSTGQTTICCQAPVN